MGMSKSRETVRTALTAEEIVGHPGMHAAIRRQSQLLLQAYDGNPRLSSVFGSQQRWLMAQAALALHFRAAPGAAPTAPGSSTAVKLAIIDAAFDGCFRMR